MVPNDQGAGYDLAILLFNEALKLGLVDDHGNVHFVAINGTNSDVAAIERSKGLALAVKKEPRIVLHQNTSGFWERDKGKITFHHLIGGFPIAKVVWVANDPMALGVLDGIVERNLVPGKNMLVGSIDWVPEALQQVRKGLLVTSVGGHFMETGWVAVLLYDYFNQKDFADETVSFRSNMGTLTKNNIDNYLQYFRSENFKQIDFTRFSKVKHPNLKRYNFRFDQVLSSLVKNTK